MRKKVLLLLLLMIAIGLLSACAKNPKKAYKDQLLEDIDTMGTKVESTYRTILGNSEKKFGYDMDCTLKGLKIAGEEFEDIKVAMTCDNIDEKFKAAVTLNYDGKKMFNVEGYKGVDNLYFMLPDYSQIALSAVDISGEENSATYNPDAEQFKKWFKEYGKMVADTFQYTGCEEKGVFEGNNFRFDATVMTGECTKKELENTLEDISDKMDRIQFFKSFKEGYNSTYDPNNPNNLRDLIKIILSDGDTKLQLKLYDGEKDNMAYEFIDTKKEIHIVFVTDGKSWSIYSTQKDKITSEFTYHIDINEANSSGYLKYSNDQIILMLKFTDAKLSNEKICNCNYKLLFGEDEENLNIFATGKFARVEKKSIYTLKIEEGCGVSGELEITSTEREAKDFELPKTSISSEKSDEWYYTIDIEKFAKDMDKFKILNKKLNTIFK